MDQGDHQCPRDEQGGEWLFHSNTPHFFKTILQRDLSNHNLRIPKKFAREHGSTLSSDCAFLKVPSGSVWKVKLHRDEDGVLLRHGWAEFVKHYNIGPGHFLVFRYDGGSKFNVIIFNKTACEIDYRAGLADEPLSRPIEKEPLSELSGDEDVELRTRVNCSKRKMDMLSRFQKSAKQLDGMDAAGKTADHLNSDSIKYSPALETAKRSGAFSRAASFRCKGRSFLVIVQPTLLRPRYLLRLPKKFMDMYASEIGPSGEMRLSVSGGDRIWTVEYVINRNCSISRGWKGFVVDNHLKVGDVCVFEVMMGKSEVAFRVAIFRSKWSVPLEGTTVRKSVNL